MHINLESDYAIRIVHCLTLAQLRMDAQTIADTTNVSLRFTLKIMRKLVSAGIVQSFKGAHGGYILACPPAEITIRQVIEAVEGPYRFSRCLDDDYVCSCGPGCPFQAVFNEVTDMVRKKLDSVTFQELSGNAQAVQRKNT